MEKFPERHKLPKLTQEEVENFNRFSSLKKIEFCNVKYSWRQKTPGPSCLVGEFYPIFKEERILISLENQKRRNTNQVNLLKNQSVQFIILVQKRKKPQNYFNRHRYLPSLNLIFFYGKSFPQTGSKRELSKPNQGHPYKTYRQQCRA